MEDYVDIDIFLDEFTLEEGYDDRIVGIIENTDNNYLNTED